TDQITLARKSLHLFLQCLRYNHCAALIPEWLTDTLVECVVQDNKISDSVIFLGGEFVELINFGLCEIRSQKTVANFFDGGFHQSDTGGLQWLEKTTG